MEENILKKAQQKKLLGDVAIEEGNFTTAFFKENSIKDLFGKGMTGEGENLRDLMEKEVEAKPQTQVPADGEESFLAKWEEALEDVEETTDTAAAKTARAEAAAEFAEFDENIPLDQENKDEDKSPAEEELEQLVQNLTPIEKYALKFLEMMEDPAQAEQLKLAEVRH